MSTVKGPFSKADIDRNSYSFGERVWGRLGEWLRACVECLFV